MKINGHSFYQHSLFSALMAGDFYGSITFAELLKHGNFGLGTFHATDGELIILDGQAYQMLATGEVNLVTPAMTTPFASLTNFVSNVKLAFNNLTFQQLEKQLVAKFPSLNIFYAIKMQGEFKEIRMRTLTKQTEPFAPLKAATKSQKEVVLKNITGDLVSFWAPQFANNIMVDGFHTHFISSDRKVGGHIFDFQAQHLTVEICYLTNIDLHLPETTSFLQHQIDVTSLQADIKQVESHSKSSS